jgi:hypothetical protein
VSIISTASMEGWIITCLGMIMDSKFDLSGLIFDICEVLFLYGHVLGDIYLPLAPIYYSLVMWSVPWTAEVNCLYAGRSRKRLKSE